MQDRKKSKPEVSVIVPVYNTQKYLVKCLNCLQEQTLKNIEIICVNDGSTDACAEILAEYAMRDKRIKFVTQENRGQSVARNTALRMISGNYVFFCDSDDFIHPQALEVLLTVAKQTGVPIVSTMNVKHYSNAVIDTRKLQYEVHRNPLVHILHNEASSSVIWNKLYKSEIVKNRPFIDGIYFEDWPWLTCLFADIEEYATVPYGINCYNTENISTMRSVFTIKKINDFAIGIRTVQKYFSSADKLCLWPLVRKIRISASIKRMVNAVYHEQENRSQLDKFLFSMLSFLRQLKCFYYKELPFKVLMRIAKIWLRNMGK